MTNGVIKFAVASSSLGDELVRGVDSCLRVLDQLRKEEGKGTLAYHLRSG